MGCSRLLREFSAEPVLDAAYRWLCQQRRYYPADADIWDLRAHWASEKPQLIQTLRTNRYQFSPNRVVRKDGETVHLWCARDALVLKAVAMVIGPRLPISPRCSHIKGAGRIMKPDVHLGDLAWLLIPDCELAGLRGKRPGLRKYSRTQEGASNNASAAKLSPR